MFFISPICYFVFPYVSFGPLLSFIDHLFVFHCLLFITTLRNHHQALLSIVLLLSYSLSFGTVLWFIVVINSINLNNFCPSLFFVLLLLLLLFLLYHPCCHEDGKNHMLPTGELLVYNISRSDAIKIYRCRTHHKLTQVSIVSGNVGKIQLTGKFTIPIKQP